RAAAAPARPHGHLRRPERPGAAAEASHQHQPRRADARVQRGRAAGRTRRDRPGTGRGGDDRQRDRAHAASAGSPLMLNLPDQAWFDVQLMHKDIHLALEAARQLSVAVPSAAVADGMLAKAEELGYARRDIAAFFEVLARMA